VTNPTPRLFTYTICIDDGAAPNPFRGMCSLAICRPGIRGVAKPGDWVAGLGSRNAHSGNLEGKLVYAMLVDEVLSLEQYDRRAPTDWPHRIPKVDNADLSERLGDCIYDFSSAVPVQRKGVLSGIFGIAQTEEKVLLPEVREEEAPCGDAQEQ
jgi:hypothetical protein